MEFLILPLLTLATAGLTFFSGFGLGSLLLPAYVMQFGAAGAVSAVAVVHLLNNLYKVALTFRNANRETLLRFGITAIVGALAGAFLLAKLNTNQAQLQPFIWAGWSQKVHLVHLVIGISIAAVSVLEVSGWFKSIKIDKKWLPFGGVLSGFFGGLSGHQGAFRTIFLVKTGLSKESLIATGAILACVIDICRITIYSSLIPSSISQPTLTLVTACSAAALAGTTVGNMFLKKVSLELLEKIIAVTLIIFGSAMALGLI